MAPQALIVHPDRKAAEAGCELLSSCGFECAIATGVQEAMAFVDARRPQLCIVGRNDNCGGLSAQQSDSERPVIAITTFATMEAAVQALKSASVSPSAEQVVHQLKPIVQSFGLGCTSQEPLMHAFPGIMGASAALRTSLRLVQKVSHSDANVLLYGESGTGKELVAKAIHASSPRADRAFIAVDCASLPEALLESELFGYEKGAFTGALKTKPGLMELARGGTLFLDEVGEIPPNLQAKLLRALQEKEHRRVGGTETIQFDVRVVSATSRDLNEEIKARKFRQDLYFRLNVVPITLPPLRERNGDVMLLANFFLNKHCEKDTGMRKSFDADALQAMEAYSWPGNVRQLENMVRRICILADAAIITKHDLSDELLPNRTPTTLSALQEKNASFEPAERSFMAARKRSMSQFEAAYLRVALDRAGGNVSRAAETAEVDRKTFYRLLRKHNLIPQAFRPRDAMSLM